jgi:coenzyme F420 biosynthesis associated uncharacterized protein
VVAAALRAGAQPGEGRALNAAEAEDRSGGAGPLADWELATRIAWQVATADQVRVTREDVALLRADLTRTVTRADDLAREATGLGADLPPATVSVIGRRAWIRSNLASIAWLADPLAAQLSQRSGVTRSFGRRVLAVQIGAVFGYLSTKVLGQYEVFRPGDVQPGRLLLVGPNLLQAERQLLPGSTVTPQQFRLGVCLHEIGHRLQFEGVPWLRGHLRGLVDHYLAQTRLDSDRARQIMDHLRDLLREPGRLADLQTLLDVVLTPEQSVTIRQAQAVMTLLEGHGNVVMDWGAEVAARESGETLDPAAVRTLLNQRRSRGADRAVRRVLGLDMKSEQYTAGERWILGVVREHGRDTFDAVWERPEHVPSPDELKDPGAWVARVAA